MTYPNVKPEGALSLPGWCNFEHIYQERVDEAPATELSTFIEIGAAFGKSAAIMGEAIRASGKPILLHAVDSFQEHELHVDILSFLNFHRESLKHDMPMEALTRWNIAQCGLEAWVNIVRDYSVNFAKRFEDESVDWCFIDGDHSYESVCADILAWWPKMKKGRWIGGHDYGMQSIFTAVHDSIKLPVVARHDVWMAYKSE